jgi:hypothetical protein
MLKILKVLAQVVWAVSIISVATLIGAAKGWEHTGMLGAMVVGTIGFFVGVVLACSPLAFFQFLSGGIG